MPNERFDTVNLLTFRAAAHLVSQPIGALAEIVKTSKGGGPKSHGVDQYGEPLYTPREFITWWLDYKLARAYAKWQRKQGDTPAPEEQATQ